MGRGPNSSRSAISGAARSCDPGKQKLHARVATKIDGLDPVDFVFDFMTRTGRMSEERLWREHPRFLAKYANARQVSDDSVC